MAKVLSSISRDSPASPVSAAVSDTFALAGTPGFGGGGGVQRYDFRWEVDDGGGFVPIAASGTGLITGATNPVVNTNSQAQQSATVTCDQPGSYTVRMVGAPVSGGSYTVVSATQTVEVASGPEEHSGTWVATGGGSTPVAVQKGGQASLVETGGGTVVLSASTGRLSAVLLTGGGAVVIDAATGRAASLVVTGGGAVVIVGEGSGGAEEHSGSWTATGGGSVSLAGSKAGLAALVLTGSGGVLTAGAKNALSVILLTGGGIVQSSGSKGAEASSALTGGGQVALAGRKGALVALALAGGGVVVLEAASGRIATLAVTGGGTVVFSGEGGTPAEEHSGTWVVTGGGTVLHERSAGRGSAVVLTGGGAFVTSAATARLGAAWITGGGRVVIAHSGDHAGVFVITGGGRVVFEGANSLDVQTPAEVAAAASLAAHGGNAREAARWCIIQAASSTHGDALIHVAAARLLWPDSGSLVLHNLEAEPRARIHAVGRWR